MTLSPRIHRHYYVALGILAVAFVVGEVYFRYLVQMGVGDKVPLAQELKMIPMKIGDWSGIDTPIAADALLRIGAMDTLHRSYVKGAGGHEARLDLYIAYFGGVRGTAPHHPDVCMPGAGWDILGRDMITLKLAGLGDASFEAHEDVFEHRSTGQKRLVIWWEYIHGENVASRALQRLKWVLPRFLGGKRGSILQVQVAQDFSGDSADSAAVITEFIDRLGPCIQKVLPKPAPEQEQQASP